MTPIVSPWFIYLLSVLDAFNSIAVAGAVIAGVVVVISLVAVALNKEFDDNDYRTAKKVAKRTTPVFIIFLLLALFVPTKNTVIAMYVTKFVTTDNVTEAIEVGGNFKDVIKKDIIEIIEAMKGEQKSDATK